MADDKTDLERRKFLMQGGTALGSVLTMPRLGLLGLFGAAAMAGAAAEGAKSEADAGDGRARRLLRGSEPLNTRGEPFGHAISGLVALNAVSGDLSSRALLVVGHGEPRLDAGEPVARRSVGVSVVDVARDEAGGWRHDVASHHNVRWHRETQLPLDGAFLEPDRPLFRVAESGEGVGEISSVVATPWGTALCAEREGWVIEVNALAGIATRRFSLGRVSARGLRVEARSGKQVAVYLAGRRLFKFVSHQRFDSRLVQANRSILMIGALYVGDVEKGQWTLLAENLGAEKWAELMHAPYASVLVPEAELAENFALESIVESETDALVFGVAPTTSRNPAKELVASAAFRGERLEDGSWALHSVG